VDEEVGLHDMAVEVLALLPMSIHQKHDIELFGDNIFVRGNKALLSTLVRNLVENASKYSEVDSPITVNVKRVGSQAVIDIIDSGPGMTDEQKINAVKRRYRVSDSQVYGSGLGLSIDLKITELHKGELIFLDKKIGSGLIARVLLPLVSVLTRL
jgi:two-component system sensor histidine kinase QseC